MNQDIIELNLDILKAHTNNGKKRFNEKYEEESLNND